MVLVSRGDGELKMRFARTLISALLVGTLKFASLCHGQEAEQQPRHSPLELRLDAMSGYAYRGMNLGGQSLQYTGYLYIGPLTLIQFANHDEDTSKWNEMDITAELAGQIGDTKLAGGYTYLTFSLGIPDTQEAYAALFAPLPLNPSLKVVYDFDEGKGLYAEAGVSRNIDPATLSATLGYYGGYCGIDGFSHLEVKASLPVAISGCVTLNTQAGASFALSPDFNNQVYAGVGINIK